MGPGLGNVAYTQAQLFKSLYTFHPASVRNPSNEKGMNVASMCKGYLLFGYGEDSGNPGGGFAFYDVSNPSAPKLVKAIDVDDLRESHAHGFHSYGGKDYFAAQSIYGVHIYDVTDVRNPVLVKDVRIPGVFADDYDHASWWLNWQAPYLYVSRGVDGFSVVNTSNLADAKVMPVLVDGQPKGSFPISKTGNFQIGPLFVVGNLLVLTNNRVGDGRGISTVDISDPSSPKLLSANTQSPGCYSMFFNGGQVFCVDGKVSVWDLAASSIKRIGESGQAGAGGEYVSVQDGFIHMGAEDRYAKIDKSSLMVVNNDFRLGGEAQEGFANPMGNLVLVTDDHGIGSSFVPHQAEPDRAAPIVNFVSPRDGAVSQALSSRVGVTFTDQIDVHSIDSASFIVRPAGGKALKGRYSSQTNIVNFSPDLPLAANTTYELVIPAGGIKDYVGNATDKAFTSRFSTGAIASVRAAARAQGPRLGFASESGPGSHGRIFRIMSGGNGIGNGNTARADMTISDLNGGRIRRIEFTLSLGGPTLVAWDGLTDGGRPLRPGVYSAMLRCGSSRAGIRMVME